MRQTKTGDENVLKNITFEFNNTNSDGVSLSILFPVLILTDSSVRGFNLFLRKFSLMGVNKNKNVIPINSGITINNERKPNIIR
ncbi:hypothetical protein VEE13_45870 (plasmid) [Escherichia coli]|nr:hypothetical protein VEE13_45870 [Escherichia coli]